MNCSLAATAGTSEGIYRLQFGSRTGQFSGSRCSPPRRQPVVADPVKDKHLFVVNENGGPKTRWERVSSYSIDRRYR